MKDDEILVVQKEYIDFTAKIWIQKQEEQWIRSMKMGKRSFLCDFFFGLNLLMENH